MIFGDIHYIKIF